MIYWLKNKINSHWKFIGRKSRVHIRRNFKANTVVIDFMGGGRCAVYDYNGKWIAG